MKTQYYEDPIIMRSTPLLILLKIVFLTFIFNLFFVIISLVYIYLRQYFWRPHITESTVFIILFITEFLIFFKVLIYWLSEYMYVNDKFLLYKTWIFSVKEIRYNLDKINNIEIKQSFFWQLLRYWDIDVSLTNDQVATLKSIPYPSQFVFLIQQKIEFSRKKNSEVSEGK